METRTVIENHVGNNIALKISNIIELGYDSMIIEKFPTNCSACPVGYRIDNCKVDLQDKQNSWGESGRPTNCPLKEYREG